ncbi:N-acetylmuramoyl-L-alanine amidase [Henriciella mobilis]|uniref:N-acetylmuramoyl-L-alanine amidase n=1 Tax=Henriciella mobilis TaxID=2305467 RepID=UPI000E664619|nr:N-acetylmuramoyl-L-alanine amidase [Henriciella mobilis]RIJ18232.1 N-acetylmuramoyl-L-alanine amidase [Henriciella mobilis]RIJ24960.1 N-acetylmuramoyl-L-alanine amidase [Henriciella mobilis]
MSEIAQQPSPNFDDRRFPVSMLVLHYTGMQTGEAALERMCDPEASVSAHYMVWESGDIVQLVDEDKRAWHAGVSRWQGEEELNSRSIGIEIVNGGHDWRLEDGRLPPYPADQIDAVIALSRDIIARWSIPQTRIVGHSDIAPTRKQDPGEHFPWARLAGQGVGLWPLSLEASQRPSIDAALQAIGYDTTDLGAAVTAFQRRWRPARVDGLVDADTRSIAFAVADLYLAS